MKLRPIILFASVTAALGLNTIGCSRSTDETPSQEPSAASKDALQDEMRLLWTQHAAWTRTLLVETLAGSSSTPHAKVRLREVHADLGDAVRPYFGDESADELTDLLEAESAAAIKLFESAQAQDQAAVTEATIEWRAQSRAIAELFANQSTSWDQEALRKTFDAHIDTTLAQVSARLEGDWAADIRAFDQLEDRNVVIADAITQGLAEAFPEQVAPPVRSPERSATHLELRELWQDRAIWTRAYVVSATAGLPDTPFVIERLAKNGDAIATALNGGPALRDATSSVLLRQSDGVAGVTNALINQDPVSVDDASASFHENAYEISEILARAGNAPQSQLSGQLQNHADSTIEQVDARIRGDWTSDVAASDELEERAIRIADLLSPSEG